MSRFPASLALCAALLGSGGALASDRYDRYDDRGRARATSVDEDRSHRGRGFQRQVSAYVARLEHRIDDLRDELDDLADHADRDERPDLERRLAKLESQLSRLERMAGRMEGSRPPEFRRMRDEAERILARIDARADEVRVALRETHDRYDRREERARAGERHRAPTSPMTPTTPTTPPANPTTPTTPVPAPQLARQVAVKIERIETRIETIMDVAADEAPRVQVAVDEHAEDAKFWLDVAAKKQEQLARAGTTTASPATAAVAKEAEQAVAKADSACRKAEQVVAANM